MLRTATKRLTFAVAALALLGAGRDEGIKSSVIRAIEKEYYREIDSKYLGRKSLPEILESLDKDSSLVPHPLKELDYIRGFKKKRVLRQVRIISPGIGYIAFDHFSEATVKGLRKAHQDLRNKGARGFILDLRGNSGGNFKSAVKIAGMMSRKDRVHLTTRKGRQTHRSGVKRPPKEPWVILTDSRTASSAEIVILAWKENNGAKVVGTRTQGKSSVQQLFPVGSSWLSLTVGHWEMDGISPGQIEPDFTVLDPEEQLTKAVKLLKN